MKRHLSPTWNSPKTARTEQSNEQPLLEVEDGRRPVDNHRPLVKLDTPHVTLHQTTPLSSPLVPSSPAAELGMGDLLVCQPVAASLLSFLPLIDWMKLRRFARCWRDAVDQQLKSLKHLNVGQMLGRIFSLRDAEINVKNKAVSFLECMANKTPAIQSLVTWSWINVSPNILKRFEKLKHLDMQGAELDERLFQVLESLSTFESLETISLPPPPYRSTRDFKDSFKGRLQLLIGRLNSLQSLTVNCIRYHPTVLEDLKHPEKLTSLFVNEEYYCPLSTIQSLPRCTNLQKLEIACEASQNPSESQKTALETALKQLKALKVVDVNELWLSDVCVQSLTQLPHLDCLRAVPRHYAMLHYVHWAEFRQLSCLDLGLLRQSFMGSINQITTLISLSFSPLAKVNFACSLPRLHTLCLDGHLGIGSFQLDFQPLCCNLQNLTLKTEPAKLHCLAKGLLKRNKGIKNLSIGWDLNGRKTVLDKAKTVANSCKSLETLVLSTVDSAEDLSLVVAVFVDGCPALKNLKTTLDYTDVVKAKFGHLNVSTCSFEKDSWLFI